VDNVEVEVIDTPVLELLLADWLDALVVVEGVPELGDNEEFLALDDTFLDSASDTLTRLLLVTVVCITCQPFRSLWVIATGYIPQAPSKSL